MKRSLVVMLLTGMAFLLQGQVLYVFDKTSLQPLPHVNIFSENPSRSTTTNSKGEADITSFQEADNIIISIVGFHLLSHRLG